MADFKTHIATSTLVGVGYGAIGHFGYQAPIENAILAAGLCSVSGMLPDIDSDSGVPLRESLAFAAAVVPMMLSDRLHRLGLSHAWLILIGAAIYLFVRFGLAWMLKKYTIHRGMFHSIPAVIIVGQIAFLLSTGDELALRIFTAASVSVGYLIHLGLDELWAFKVKRGRIRMKSTFGTALKLYSGNWFSNLSAYAKLSALTFLVMQDPAFMSRHPDPGADGFARSVQSRMASVRDFFWGPAGDDTTLRR